MINLTWIIPLIALIWMVAREIHIVDRRFR